MDTKQKGSLIEIHCIAEFVERGYTVSIPYGDNSRYDFIVDINNILYKVQCKAAQKQSNGTYLLPCISCHKRATGNKRNAYSNAEVDFFCTYVEQKCYLIPIKEVARRSKTLRFELPKNGQGKNVCYADIYELDK